MFDIINPCVAPTDKTGSCIIATLIIQFFGIVHVAAFGFCLAEDENPDILNLHIKYQKNKNLENSSFEVFLLIPSAAIKGVTVPSIALWRQQSQFQIISATTKTFGNIYSAA